MLFEPRDEPALPAGRLSAFATGIPGAVAIYYRPVGVVTANLLGISPDRFGFAPARVTVDPGANYSAFYLNPRNGAETDLGAVSPDADGSWMAPVKPTMEDWVLVLEDRAALTRISGRVESSDQVQFSADAEVSDQVVG